MAGLGKRFLDLARANLNALLDRANADLEDFSDEELKAELDLRDARRRREDETRTAREAAERAARERAKQRASSTGTAGAGGATGSRARSTPPPPRRPPPSSSGGLTDEQRKLAHLYAMLETPYGADLETVKKNFRRLMRLHHPDVAGAQPEAQKRATETTAKLTLAYNELELLLAPRR